MNTATTSATVALALLLSAQAALAQAPQDPPPGPPPATQADAGAPTLDTSPDKWSFRFTPYFMLGAMDGNVTVRGRTSEVSQDLGDVVDTLKDYLNFGAAVHFEAEKNNAGQTGKNNWGIFADFSYMDLKAERDSTLGNRVLEASLKQFMGELGGFYTVVPAKTMSEGGSTTFRLDLLGGVRVTWLDMEIDPDNTGATSGDKAWLDPFIGARAFVGFNDWLTGRFRGDIGGFDLSPGNTSKFAWQLDAALVFRLSNAIDLEAGYRLLSQDYDDGSGATLFEYDILINGPYMGLTFKF